MMHTQPQTAGLLSSRAMLASLSIKCWNARKVDQKATAETIENNNAEDGVGRFYKRLVAKEATAAYAKAASAARQDHYALTLPWQDSGARILPAKAHAKHTERMREHEARFRDAVRAFSADYAREVHTAARA